MPGLGRWSRELARPFRYLTCRRVPRAIETLWTGLDTSAASPDVMAAVVHASAADRRWRCRHFKKRDGRFDAETDRLSIENRRLSVQGRRFSSSLSRFGPQNRRFWSDSLPLSVENVRARVDFRRESIEKGRSGGRKWSD